MASLFFESLLPFTSVLIADDLGQPLGWGPKMSVHERQCRAGRNCVQRICIKNSDGHRSPLPSDYTRPAMPRNAPWCREGFRSEISSRGAMPLNKGKGT